MNIKKVWTWSRVAQDAVEVEVDTTLMTATNYYWYFKEPISLSKGYTTDSSIERHKCFDTKLECLEDRLRKLRKVKDSATKRFNETHHLWAMEELKQLETTEVSA